MKKKWKNLEYESKKVKRVNYLIEMFFVNKEGHRSSQGKFKIIKEDEDCLLGIKEGLSLPSGFCKIPKKSDEIKFIKIKN